MPQQGDIVLIQIPYSDLSQQKRRPALVISNDDYNRSSADVIVVALTSNSDRVLYSFTLTSADLVTGNLQRNSQVRVDKVYTLSQQLVLKVFGRVKDEIIVRVQETLQQLTSPTT
jgi:mRNA interferase MazF